MLPLHSDLDDGRSFLSGTPGNEMVFLPHIFHFGLSLDLFLL